MNFYSTRWMRRRLGGSRHWLTALIVTIALCCAIPAVPLPLLAQSEPTPASTAEGFYYTVRRGESWSLIADRHGLTVRQLKGANPGLVRYNDVLRVGDQLLIPGLSAPTPTTTPSYQEYVVQRGEGWYTIAEKFDVRVGDLFDANPHLIRYNYILRTGDRMLIPVTVAAAPAAAEAEAAPATPTPSPEGVATETPSPTATEELGITEEITATVPATTTEEIEVAPAALCPTDFIDYPAAIEGALNAADGNPETVVEFLESCGAAVADGIHTGDWSGDGAPDVLVIYANPTTETTARQTDLIILNSGAAGYSVSYRARAAGTVTLLATEDINADRQPDVVWVDRTCGVSTCFDTVEVVSWDGSQWRDWTQDSITMAYADIQLEDTTAAGQGQEIILEGGIYGSVGAGPQRSRTEVWASIDGLPYSLLERTNAASDCLYHTVLDANEAFRTGSNDGFATAEDLYTKAATDEALEACWTRTNELDELRSFSLFRLALTAAYQGQPGVATDLIGSLSAGYPDSVYDQVGQTWLAVYEEENDLAAACSAANQFATDNPEAYELLADYGYANPGFTAGDVCPVLDVESLALGTGQAITSTLAITGAITGASTGAAAGTQLLPTCPEDLSGYPEALPALLTAAEGDELIIETWLRQCDAMSDERGGFVLMDINDDGALDAIIWPTVVSDLGFGPDGAQGDLLIYHGDGDGGYELAADEEIYGQPALLAADDLNGDDRPDLAWQVVGCSTFCVLEVQVVSWNGEEYVSIIEPGATIAEGSAHFEPVAEDDPGAGQQLVLIGGVSGTAEGGLAVPHTEIWQSIEGANFQRIRWLYDRTVEGSDCLGLRMVEADMALQAAPVLGYELAIELYNATFDPELTACSIFGLTPEEELKLLQGLATFRLIQAEALNGDLEAARSNLTALTRGQPEGEFTRAATEWLAAYSANGNARAACQTILKIFVDNTLLWQITDHYGYNHPALAAEQLCYAPE
jgi:LysM repeat protein